VVDTVIEMVEGKGDNVDWLNAMLHECWKPRVFEFAISGATTSFCRDKY